MGEDDPDITAEEFATWITPVNAVACLTENGLHYNTARDQLLKRITNGLIRAAASVVTVPGSEKIHSSPYEISKTWWREITHNNEIWRTGDGVLRAVSSVISPIHINVFGVRFETRAVQEAADQSRHTTDTDVPSVPSATSHQLEKEQKGPPVAEAHLREWYQLYRKTYPDADDTEANALNSARGMFPGKSVSRESVRNLRGNQPRGRKPVKPAN